MDALLEVENVTKSYGRNRVLHKLCLSVEPCEVVVIRGINGSGKTTLLSIIASLVSCDYGMVKIQGQDLRSNPHRVRSNLAFVAHQPFLYSQLTVKENLEFFGRLNSIDNLDSTILEKAALIGLSNRLDSKITNLSHGYIKRVAIARSLLHDPRILLLDEPESGLDEDSLRLFEKIICDQLEGGKSIVMTTHASQISYRGNVRNQRISKGILVDDIP